MTETVEDFQIRKIKLAIAKIENNGEEIKEWKILRLAGLRGNISDKVRTKLEQDSQ